jgi:hypothetical protein
VPGVYTIEVEAQVAQLELILDAKVPIPPKVCLYLKFSLLS